jgi:hypothetical protein
MTQHYPVPPPAGSYIPANVPVITYTGGAYGDDVAVSTANATNDYAPRHQTDKATQLGVVMADDITSPRGWIDPNEAYVPAPMSPADDPTITSLAPNTGVSGGAAIWAMITGTKFTQWSQVETGGVVTPYSKYVSPTRIDVLMDPRSTPGMVVVKVIDHGVKSNGSNFTFT